MAVYTFDITWTDGARVEIEAENEVQAYDRAYALTTNQCAGSDADLPAGITVSPNDSVCDWTVELSQDS